MPAAKAGTLPHLMPEDPAAAAAGEAALHVDNNRFKVQGTRYKYNSEP